jgi:hypothetical protein
LLLFLSFIFPLGIYCLILGVLNRRDRPLLVSGPWDFAGVLFGASGLLLFVVPFGVLPTLHEMWQYYWLFGQTRDLSYNLWLAVWYLYYGIVVSGAAYLLWRRRCQTAIYNVELSSLEVALARVLERLDMNWTREDNHFFFRPDGKRSLQSEAVAPVPLPTAALAYSVELEVESFPALSHATLRWHEAEEPLRQDVERELRKVLAGMPTRFNMASGWFLSLASLLFFTTLLGILITVLRELRIVRW